jgi:hypothetical protein
LLPQRRAAHEENEMPKVAREELTERQRECLKHFREAQERGVSFAEYCRSEGLKANEWHAVKHGMARKGLLSARSRRGAAARKQFRQRRSRFIPVRVEPSICEMSAGAACRLRHASGWVIECTSLPELHWLKGLIGSTQP